MIKNLISDYMRVYNWDNFKKSLKNNFFNGIIFLWIFLDVLGALNEKENVVLMDHIIFMILYLPLCLILISNQSHSVRLEKMMYLCPMDIGERRAYIYSSYYFRVTLHIVISAIMALLLIPISYCDAFSAIEIFLNGLIISMFIPSGEVTGKKSESADVLRGVMTAIALLLNVAQLGIILDEEPDITLKIVIGIFLLIQFQLLYRYRKWVKQELEGAVNYEEN